jgi:hypothetical protein
MWHSACVPIVVTESDQLAQRTAFQAIAPETEGRTLPCAKGHRMIEYSLQAMAAALANKEISSVELTQLYLERIARHNSHHSTLTLPSIRPAVLPRQRAADARLARGDRRTIDRHPDRA